MQDLEFACSNYMKAPAQRVKEQIPHFLDASAAVIVEAAPSEQLQLQ